MKIRFETRVCSRCDGTGRHQHNQIDGDVCYGCGGTTRQLTKDGKAAREAYDALIDQRCNRPVRDVKAGDMIWRRRDPALPGIPPMFTRSGYYQVLQSTETEPGGGWMLGFTPSRTGESRSMHCPPDHQVRVYNREAIDQTMKDVARDYPGATLLATSADEEEYVAAQTARDAKVQASREKRRARADQQRAERDAKRAAEHQARQQAGRDAWRAAHPDLAELADGTDLTGYTGDSFVSHRVEMASIVQVRGLTDKETARFRTVIAREQAEQAAKAASVHFGTVDAKTTITATIDGRKQMPSGSYLVALTEKSTGATLKTFTDGSWPWDHELGEEITFTAVVKKHSDWRGHKETEIKNVRVKKGA